MKSRPILFSTSMVQALLEGRKTQTRRIVKGSLVNVVRFIGANDKPTWEYGFCATHDRVINKHIFCPYGKPGDLLWVRETFVRGVPRDGNDMPICGEDGEYIHKIWYAASNPDLTWDNDGEKNHNNPPWKPSIHMPRTVSRLTLEITNLRVERLQDISTEDAEAEGLYRCKSGYIWFDSSAQNWLARAFIAGFQSLWKSINGKDSWHANPWVWVIEFKVHKCNVDNFNQGRE